MIRLTRDVAFGCATLALAVAYYMAATAIPESFLSDAVGPQGLPRLYAVILAALSLILILKGTGGRGKGEGEDGNDKSLNVSKGLLLRVLGMLMIGVLYVALVAVSGALFLWLLFVQVLGIPQPAGLLPSLF